jgi:hypothetical protein
MRAPLSFILLLLLSINISAQELIGTDRTFSGTLALFEIVPSQEASWHIVPPPASAGETYQIDSNSSRLYFASPVPGRYTVIAGIVTDGTPNLLVKTFINGAEKENPSPIPAPPIATLESWLQTQLPVLVKSKNIASETQIVAECFEQIIQRIDTANIATAQNARTQLQITLAGRLALASPTAVTDWTPFLTELSRQLEKELGEKINSLNDVTKTLQSVSDTLKSLELPNSVRMPLPNIDNPNNRGQGTPNRTFRNIFAR